MKNSLRISLKNGEKLFINGAVLRADRKVILEFLNDINFMLEHHILKEEETTTPLRQLYFIVQMILINPAGKDYALSFFQKTIGMLLACACNEEMFVALKRVEFLVMSGRFFEALKIIRSFYDIETQVIIQDEVFSSTIEYIQKEIALWK
ncbi:Flagellar protein flbT [Liberibacter crescens BT-1]|uniref:Flagellar protein flbT n=1 Tax=Liberibacter crescens (strain BT-1) TaxID=1215343 RepID=L0ETR4_LIBCB|nr:flagellar biosynthesis repressor FlbT [Liberibacter crescens]AGA64934.1 Flagellar protein flbT [Liberibacter crescens BT-1]AMC12956.1 flagellum biosynthesis protein FlbT [Liberibacter crescens]